jgi:hypothetical protein
MVPWLLTGFGVVDLTFVQRACGRGTSLPSIPVYINRQVSKGPREAGEPLDTWVQEIGIPVMPTPCEKLMSYLVG